jgi:hypothetical protein
MDNHRDIGVAEEIMNTKGGQNGWFISKKS